MLFNDRHGSVRGTVPGHAAAVWHATASGGPTQPTTPAAQWSVLIHHGIRWCITALCMRALSPMIRWLRCVTAAGRPNAQVDKDTTVSVAKIAASVDSATMRSLLESCGALKEWKPVLDDQGKMKGFGFAKYEVGLCVQFALCLSTLQSTRA